MTRDRVFARKRGQIQPFSFNREVAEVFDDMLVRSVPLYKESLYRQADLVRRFFQAFPDTWKSSVFFYMCMEDVDLWEPVLGRSYPSNEAFEQDMLRSYRQKIHALRKNRKPAN